MPHQPSFQIWHNRAEPMPVALEAAYHRQHISLFHEPLSSVAYSGAEVAEKIGAYSITNPRLSLIATSAHAIRTLASQRKWHDLPLWLVGKQTEELARSYGFTDCHTPTDPHGAEALCDYMITHAPKDRHYLYIRGEYTHTDISYILNDYGFRCDDITAYRINWLNLSDALIQQWPLLDGTLIYSRKTATHLCHQLEARKLNFKQHPFFCLSPSCAAPLEAAGAHSIHISTTPDSESLLECVKDFIASVPS